MNNKGDNAVKKAKSFTNNDKFVFIWTSVTIALSVFIALVVLLASSGANIPVISSITAKISGLISDVNVNSGLNILGGRQNILLLGVDANGNKEDPFKGSRSDTIILLSIDPLSKSVNAISIPRDSKVPIANGFGLDKINAAHALGGADLTVRTVESVFGVKINHFIAVDYNGIKEVVKALDGVPVYVEKRMRYRDYAGGLNINLKPGLQVLNAEDAEGYLRFRHDAVGDIGRMQRQQWFIRGLVKRLQSPDVLIKIPQLIQLAGKYIRTDMNFYELSQLASFAKSIDLKDVQTATLPGGPSSHGHISYWILESDKVQDIIDRLVYRESSSNNTNQLTASIIYSREMADNIPTIRETLTKEGYNVSCVSKSNESHTQFLAHTNNFTMNNAKSLREKLPEFKNAQFVVSLNNFPCAESDVTLVLSENTGVDFSKE